MQRCLAMQGNQPFHAAITIPPDSRRRVRRWRAQLRGRFDVPPIPPTSNEKQH